MSGSHASDEPDQGTQSHASDWREQDTRSVVQYAEFDPNTAPQVRLSSAPEVVSTPIEPDVAHQGPGDAGPRVVVGEKTQGHKGFWARLGRRKIQWLIGLAVAVCIILTVGISVPLIGDKIGRSKKGGGGTSSSDPGSPTTTDPTPSSGSTSKVPECERDRYTADVDWVGIRNGNDWDFELKSLGGAAECCAYCYETARECNAWLYVPARGPGPDCTLITGYGGDYADNECPAGRPDVMFNIEDGKGGNFAGTGPCAGFIKML